MVILRRRQTPSFRTGSRVPLSINPEQTTGFRPGNVEGLILTTQIAAVLTSRVHLAPSYPQKIKIFPYFQPGLINFNN
jgi:hypothetical protein